MPPKSIEPSGLTKAEERVMKAVWQKEPALVRELIAVLPDPKPHPNTINTILKILAEKGYVRAEQVGNAYRYQSLISQESFSRKTLSLIAKNYFNGSFASIVSCFIADKKLDIVELEEILKTLKQKP
ncbi:MAG: BlaI/MecI/CopY family transcriptional regulator [Bacteroidetes bacterium]|nr:BlaI/MecI/CopY family transcriptional regulator [Bacteroidota bacterium]